MVFYGRKVLDCGQPAVYVINDIGEKVGEIVVDHQDIDDQWQQYIIDITKVKGGIQIIFNGGYVDNKGSLESDYIFSDIVLY